MSDKRRADMDTIELGQLPPVPSASGGSGNTTSPIDTILDPVPGTPDVVPGDDVDTSGKNTTPEENEDEDDEGQEGAIPQNRLQQVGGSVWGAINSVKNGVGHIPTPVGLALPILVWMILFLLIVQVNGNSRIGWLWLVLSNNAYVSTTQSNTVDVTSTPITPTATQTIPGIGITPTLLDTSSYVNLSQEFV